MHIKPLTLVRYYSNRNKLVIYGWELVMLISEIPHLIPTVSHCRPCNPGDVFIVYILSTINGKVSGCHFSIIGSLVAFPL